MKVKIQYIALFLLAGFSACKKDNYDAPSDTFSGRIVYKGEPIGVEYNQVNFELWQPGFGKNAAISLSIGQDGSFSQLLFNGNYKLTIPPNQGPFLWKQNAAGRPDTVAVTMSGSQTMDIEVMPFYMIRNSQITAASQKVTANFKLEKIITDAVNGRDIDRVYLYLNKTQFVSGGNNIASADIAGSAILDPNNISLTADIPAMTPTQNYVFARIGVRIAGVEDMMFSPLVKVSF
ncbi:DUF3823 domain-containing protein [Pedobacter sp. HMF7647]|uniref:DUF3823 domain-containing protein n=1 Tax=Hufsiella arboris TaxID=2695275 RepID=A0A7K1Y9H7_9SPHI|nr:DUF3823 domain-containing protein [Hufsiella arboris]MXV51001.1 DUF3823 domain-containing protein [Hufsiella arboris]